MSWWIMALIIALSFCVMELVAWATHKYVMHGFLWHLHQDHHIKRPGVLQKNDSFILVFAIPSWLFIMLGVIYSSETSICIGTGTTIYGIAYFLVHEVLIHQRLKWFRKTDNAYFKAIRRAHKIHHKHIDKKGSENFGMLLVKFKYFQKEQGARQKHPDNA